jgi:cell division protein FtsI/penicillin-binding protein 2
MLLYFVGQTRPAARFYYVGDKVVINSRTIQGTNDEVRLMGYQMPIGRHAWIKTGDWLYMRGATTSRPLNETFIFSAGETRPIVTAVRQQNDKSQRFYPEDAKFGWEVDQAGQPVPFFEILARRMDRILNHLPPEQAESLVEDNIQLSLRRDLQTHLNKAFHGECDNIRTNKKYDDKPFPAGITVMDGKSGKILAMSTYPWPEDLPQYTESKQRRLWLRNQNFVRHPIGSASKQFFYAAITETYPPLLDLEIDAYLENHHHKELLHCTLGGGYEIHTIPPRDKNGKPIRKRVDMMTALEKSSNKYTIELATLALAADRSTNLYGRNIKDWIPEDPNYSWPKKRKRSIWIKGQNLRYAPDITGYIDDKPPRCNTMIAHFETIGFRVPLEQLTGASTYLGKASHSSAPFDKSSRTRRYDMRIWTPLLSHLTKRLELTKKEDIELLWTVRSDFKGVSPERVNLAFNQINTLRGDYMSLLLGSGTGVWTNIQLAEAMSRLVTGRQVNAALVSAILNEDGATETQSNKQPPLVPLRSEVREKVLIGSRRVAETGTARSLRYTLRDLKKRYPNDKLFFYSKTGSPTLVSHVPKASGKALKILVSRSYLLFKNSALYIQFEGKIHRYPSSAFDQGLSKVLRNTGTISKKERRKIVKALKKVFARFIANRAQFSWANRAGLPDTDTIDSPLYLLEAQLKTNPQDKLFSKNKVKSKGANYVLSLVKVPQKVMGRSKSDPTVEQIAHPDTKVITIALHLEMGDISWRAVRVAKKLLKEIQFLDY